MDVYKHPWIYAKCTWIFDIVPEKRDLNEANMKIEIYSFFFSSHYLLQNEL